MRNDQMCFGRLLQDTNNQQEQQIILTYEQRGYDCGFARGFARGFADGIEQGILQATRRIILRTTRARFGDLSHMMLNRIEAISDIAVLDELSVRVLTAPTLDAMNIPE